LDTIRRYAADRLDAAGEKAAAQAAHASYFYQLAREAETALVGPKQVSWLDRLSLDHENFRLALTYLGDTGEQDRTLEMLTWLARYWGIRADMVEVMAAFEAALAGADSKAPRQLLGRALAVACAVAQVIDVDASWRWGQAALEIARATNDDALAADAQTNLAFTSVFRGQPDQALALESLAAARRVGDRVLIGRALSMCGLVYWRSDNSQAIRYYQECISTTTASGDLTARMQATGNLALVYVDTRELGLAHTLCEAAVHLQEELGYADPIGRAYFAGVLMEEGDFQRAYEWLMIALRMPQNSPAQIAIPMSIGAGYALRVEAFETAAVLQGFVDQMVLQIGLTNDDPDVSVLQAKLGERYNEYQERGRTLSWEEAVALITDLSGSNTSHLVG
jgi:tetratricopeptide (TPR) repeat protein